MAEEGPPLVVWNFSIQLKEETFSNTTQGVGTPNTPEKCKTNSTSINKVKTHMSIPERKGNIEIFVNFSRFAKIRFDV